MNALLDALAPPPRGLETDEFTADMYAVRHGMTTRAARDWLKSMTLAGKLTCRETVTKGVRCRAWRVKG